MKKGSLKKNFFMNALLTMSSFVFPLITFPYVSRILLPVGTGKVSFATSLISYFLMFAQLGIPTYGIRICAQVRDDNIELSRVAHELLFINVAMSLVSYLFLGVALWWVPRLYADRTLYMIVSLTIILNAIGMEWLFKALEEYTYITVRSLIFKVVSLLAMFLLIHEQKDYVIYGGISIFAASASNILNFCNVHKYITLRPVGQYNVKRHLKPVVVFFAMACATTIYTHLDTVMLGFMATDEDVGYYNAAVRIKGILVSIVTSLGVVLLPRASYYLEHGLKDDFLRISQKALNFVCMIATPMMVYFMLFAKEGVFFLSGDAYVGSILPMQLIMPTLLFIGLTNILGIQMLVPMGKEKIVLCSVIAGAITDVVLNAILIPQYAAVGVAIGTVVAEFVVLLVQYYSLRRECMEFLRTIHYGKILLALLAGITLSVWIKLLNYGSFVSLLISAVLFFSGYGLLLWLSKEPMIMEIMRILVKRVKALHGKNEK